MIPVRLGLRNFMCYASEHQALEFDGIHVACLSGPNGHGKSALLDAITWALWGKSRAKSADDLIRVGQGAREMEVEFDFRLGEQQYRVLRKRSRRARTGHTLLDLQIRDQDGYRQIGGNNVAETERQIQQLLRMSYETFTNSAFILQGKADAFTTKTAGERKQVLAEILDLSSYDRLEERARQRVAERNEQAAILRQQIADDDLELQRRPELERQLAALEAEQAGLEGRLEQAESRGRLLQERLHRLQADRAELERQAQRAAEASERAGRQRAVLARLEVALQQAAGLVERQAEIEQRYQDLLRHRAELERLVVVQAEHGRLSQDLARLEQQVAAARGQLEGRAALLRKQRDCLTRAGSDLAQLAQALQQARSGLEAFEQVEAERSAVAQELLRARERFAELKALGQQLAEQQTELAERKKLLGRSPTCPVCRTELGAAGQRAVMAQLRDEAGQRAVRIEALREQQGQLECEGRGLRARLERLETRLGERRAAQEKSAKTERELAESRQRAQALDGLRVELKAVEAQLATASYAAGQQAELALLRQQLASLSYDGEAHKRAAGQVTRLSGYESLRHELLAAQQTLVRDRQAHGEAQRLAAEWEAIAAEAERLRGELAARTADLPAVEQEAAAAEAELRSLRLEQGRLHQELGGVRQHLATMDFTARRRVERLAELERTLAERSLYLELVQAFGKKGVQALLIETAIPEIEAEANRLLGVLTEGRMRVRLETQKQARSSDATIETLEIVIQDELGDRAYELFSGGEAFRVNFALRIALSKLLAHRAGARLQTLVIDEGFGTQDEEGLGRLIEAIKAIQDEFEMILVITHLTDLKDAFPVRIEVQKTPDGSTIQIN